MKGVRVIHHIIHINHEPTGAAGKHRHNDNKGDSNAPAKQGGIISIHEGKVRGK